MKKIILAFFVIVLSASSFIYTKNQPHKIRLGDTIVYTFLFTAGSWLAYKQLPRLAGQQIEYNAPIFTKMGASVLFAIGIAGGVVGAYKLVFMIREKLNEFKK